MNHAPRAVAGWSMTDQEFDDIRRMIYSYSGIVIGPEKRSMIRARLQKRLIARGLASLQDYLCLVQGHEGASEREQFISSLTTNVTSFFREAHHFSLLTGQVLADTPAPPARIHIWSAGCSSGQEPYSIALSILGQRPDLAARTKILATDIDSRILARARAAIYPRAELSAARPDLVERYCHQPAGDPDPDRLQLGEEPRAMVEFRQLNLNGAWHLPERFDVIFCRNVAIYFDQNGQHHLWRRFHGALRPGGWLLVGHSERVPAEMHDILRPGGMTAYQKPL